MVSTILVAIEDLSRRQAISKLLIHQGYRIIEASSGSHTIELLRRRSNINLLFLDLEMSDINGLNFIETVRSAGIFIPILIVAIKEDENKLSLAIKSGANDFIIHPFSDIRLMVTIKNIMQKADFERRIKNFDLYNENNLKFSDLVAKSYAMQEVISLAKNMVKNNHNILIKGEHGTGRNTLAKTIHQENGHDIKTFYNIQCLHSLNNEEYTIDWKQKIRKTLNNITKGTLVFNNIEYLTLDEQQCLYTYLHDLSKNESTNIRLIAISTPEIDEMLHERLINKKLYKIFAKQSLFIPPLRNRIEDIGDIAKNILMRIIAETDNLHVLDISNTAIHFLSQYQWPGNIIELNKIIFSAMLISNGPLLSISDFPQVLKSQVIKSETIEASNNSEIEDIIFDKSGNICSISEIEHLIIKTAMNLYEGRISEVARRLKISRSTLYRKLEEFKIAI